LGNLFCAAQSDRQKYEVPGLILEITYDKENKPAYVYVTDHILQSRGNLFSNFQRVGNWRQPAGSLSVKAVRIVSRPEGNSVKVKVSVLTGQKPNETEQTVANYTLRENERVTVNDLAKFGIEPFEIRAVGLTLAASDLPQIVNKTGSLTIEKLELANSETPSVKLVLANNSDKAVSALVYKVSVGKSLRSSGRPENMDGKILIRPGERFQAIIPNVGFGVKNSVGQTVSLEPNKTITISAVVFEDDSFEGEDAEAARFLVVRFARKVQTKKILALLEQTAPTDLNQLNGKAENLGVEIDENDFDKFTGQFAALPDNEKFYLRSAANAVLKGMKSEFVSELESLNQGQIKAESAENRNRLKTIKDKYQSSLSRLN
jgi:hypothetical protein